MARHSSWLFVFCAAFSAGCAEYENEPSDVSESDSIDELATESDSELDSASDGCGNSFAENDEICDGSDLKGQSCETLGLGYTGGVLSCEATCKAWDESQCTTCGDNKAEGDELCDGSDLGESDCPSLGQGYTHGTLICNGDCQGFDDSACTTCGNNEVEGKEVCDGANLQGKDCQSLGLGYTDGKLACRGDCQDFDDSACTTCGDNYAAGTELCDGTDLTGKDCQSLGLGYTGGTLSCVETCDDFDDALCTTCGDNTAEGNEVCDGADLAGESCASLDLGFTDGNLSCNAGCSDFVISACTTCGDDLAESPEVCDDVDLAGESCETLGYTGGWLSCSETCLEFNTGRCNKAGSTCGNGVAELGEACDGYDIGNANCGDFGAGDSGTVTCRANCTLDLSGCEALDLCTSKGYYGDGKCQLCQFYGGEYDADCSTVCKEKDGICESAIDSATGLTPCVYLFGESDPDCICGNSKLDGGEQCDGTELAGASCKSLGYQDTGGLACLSNCTYDTTGCVAYTCGDGIVEGKEVCDKQNLNGADCSTIFGGTVFSTGTLGCKNDCTWDYSGCVFIGCGDGIVNSDEQCDGIDLAGADCTTLDQGYFDGSLQCDDGCFFDVSECRKPECGNQITEVIPNTDWEQCDGTDLQGQSCQTLGFDYGYPLVCDSECRFKTVGCGHCPSDEFADCNLNPQDGCEVNITTDEDHCGGCGARCAPTANVLSTVCQSSNCKVTVCQIDYYDKDGSYMTGCECHADTYPNTCTNAENVGTINYGATVTRGGNLTEPNDVDWWTVTFQKSKNCNYSPKIVLNAGTRPIRMEVFPGCTGGAGTGRFSCKESSPNNSDQAMQVYEIESFSDCGNNKTQDTSSYNSENHSTDGFFENTLPETTYIRVFPIGTSASCMDYTLTFSN